VVSLKSRLKKFFGRHHDLANRYEISVSQMTADMYGPSFLFHDIIQFLTRTTRLVPLVPSGAGNYKFHNVKIEIISCHLSFSLTSKHCQI
jgi:hypothetical protein